MLPTKWDQIRCGELDAADLGQLARPASRSKRSEHLDPVAVREVELGSKSAPLKRPGTRAAPELP